MDATVLWLLTRGIFELPKNLDSYHTDMKSELAKELRKRFEGYLLTSLPDIRLTRVELPPGWKAYSITTPSGLSFYIVLAIAPQFDRFTVEIAWSKTGALPPLTTSPDDIKGDLGNRFRLSRLWQRYGGETWWTLGKEYTLDELATFPPEQPLEEKLADIDRRVSQAIESILTFAVPYFRRVAQSNGELEPFGKLQRQQTS